MLDRSIAPPFSLPDNFELLEAESRKLSNNIPIHYISAGEQDVLRLELIFNAGTKFEMKNGISFFTAKMLFEGTKKLTSSDIFNYLDQRGAFYEINHAPDAVYITIYLLSKHLEDISQLLMSLLTESVFPEAELNNLKNISLQGLRVNLTKTNFIAATTFRSNLFGQNHPYGKLLDEQAIAQVSQEDVVDFYKKHYLNQPFDVVLSGKIQDKDIEVLNNYFGTISTASNLNIPQVSPDHIISQKKQVILKPESVQSSIRIGKKSLRKNHPDYFDLVVLNEALGGYFGSRLMKNIREDKGYTYGIHSAVHNYRDESYFAIGADVKKEFTAKAIEEILKEINVLKNTPIPEEELLNVKNYLKGSFLNSLNTPFSLADKFKGIYFHGLGYDFYKRFYSRITEVTSEELMITAQKHLNTDDFVTVIAGENI